MTKIVLLTGFLGAGKTTFLNNILEECKENKIGVIINEYSETGIDGELISNNGFNIIELTNGSIFCACIKGKFVDSLIAMDLYGFEYIFIEASGLADPSNIGNIISELKKLNKIQYEYLGSVCIVDAVYFLEHLDLLPAIERQIKHSNAVIINKVDLSTREKIRSIKESINSINYDINIYSTSYGKVQIKEIIKELSHSTTDSEETTNTEADRTKTLTIKTIEPISKKGLESFLEDLCKFTYRIKGFCITDDGIAEVSAVGDLVTIQSSNITKNETVLVVFSSVGISIVSEVIRLSKKYYKETVTIK